MNTHTIVLCSPSLYLYQTIDLPEDFTAADVNDAVKSKFGKEYGFKAIYPYGPYKRAVSSTLTIVLRRD